VKNIVDVGNKIDIISGISENKSGVVKHSILKPSLAVNNSVHHVKVYDSEEAAQKRELKTHYVAAHKKPHITQHSKTLRRTAVKKPTLRDTGKLIKQSQGTLYEKQVETANLVVTKNALSNQIRHNATKTPKSSLVNKFGAFTVTQQTSKPVYHNPVQTAPAVIHQPVISEPISNKTRNPFDSAIERSNSHLEKPHHVKKRKKAKRIKLTILALLIILTALVSIYHTDLNRAYVSYVAKFSIGIPKYSPSGYELNGTIGYANNQVTLVYTNGIVGYSLIEQKYPLSDTQLQNYYLSVSNQQYVTIAQGSKNIYIYSDKNATWVSNSVWYNLVNNSGLTNDEITKIAAST
jgi:hypothetical protein